MLKRIQRWQAEKEFRARRADFYYDLANALEDRVPLFTTLRKYEARARRRDPGAVPMYQSMLRAAQSGSLSDAMRGIVPNNELIMLDAIQSSGDEAMAKGLYFMSETVEKTDRMVRTMKKAVTYPLILFVLFSGMLAAFSFFAVPVLESLLPPEKWPFMGRVLYAISSAVREFGIFIAAAIVIGATAFIRSLPRWSGPSRKAFDKRLPYSLYRDFSGAMLIVSLSSLMRTGVSLRSSLERAVRFSTPWMRWHLREILRTLAGGGSSGFGQAFNTGVLSQVMEDRVQDASERRDPVTAFVRIGVGSIDRIERNIQESAGRINNIMIAAAGIVLGIMMMGFFMTAFEMQTGIQSMGAAGPGR